MACRSAARALQQLFARAAPPQQLYVGMPAETSLAICSLMLGGVLERLPTLKVPLHRLIAAGFSLLCVQVMFAHGGGAFPGTISRVGWGNRTYRVIYSCLSVRGITVCVLPGLQCECVCAAQASNVVQIWLPKIPA